MTPGFIPVEDTLIRSTTVKSMSELAIICWTALCFDDNLCLRPSSSNSLTKVVLPLLEISLGSHVRNQTKTSGLSSLAILVQSLSRKSLPPIQAPLLWMMDVKSVLFKCLLRYAHLDTLSQFSRNSWNFLLFLWTHAVLTISRSHVVFGGNALKFDTLRKC